MPGQRRPPVLEVCSLVGPAAAELVRQAWHEYPEGVAYWSLVQATAACLPFEDGFARAERALADMPEKARRESFSALAHFRSAHLLSWIEANACEPTTEAWGRLAAASAFSWGTAKAWIGAGRPLNLIAIDALLAIADPRTPLLRALQPSLGAPTDEGEMRQALSASAANASPPHNINQSSSAPLGSGGQRRQLRQQGANPLLDPRHWVRRHCGFVGDVGSYEVQARKQNPEKLALVYVPAVTLLLQRAEQLKGSPLSPTEVARISSQAEVVAMPNSVAEAVVRERGGIK